MCTWGVVWGEQVCEYLKLWVLWEPGTTYHYFIHYIIILYHYISLSPKELSQPNELCIFVTIG